MTEDEADAVCDALVLIADHLELLEEQVAGMPDELPPPEEQPC